MATFSCQPGIAPSYGLLSRWRRRKNGLTNDDLMSAIELNDPDYVKDLLAERSDRNLEDPVQIVKNVNNGYECWRTPLECAIDKGAHPEIVDQLLKAGARITPLALELAFDGMASGWGTRRDQKDIQLGENIANILTTHQADWKSAAKAYSLAGRERENFEFTNALLKLGIAPETVKIAPKGVSLPKDYVQRYWG